MSHRYCTIKCIPRSIVTEIVRQGNSVFTGCSSGRTVNCCRPHSRADRLRWNNAPWHGEFAPANSASRPASVQGETVIVWPPRIPRQHCQPMRVVGDQRDETLRVPLRYWITVSISNYTPSWIDTGGRKKTRPTSLRFFERGSSFVHDARL